MGDSKSKATEKGLLQNSSENQTTFRSCRVHFCIFFPTTFLELAVL